MLLYYFLVPLREGLLSESVLIKAGPYIVVSAVVCVTYLLFTFLGTVWLTVCDGPALYPKQQIQKSGPGQNPVLISPILCYVCS